MVNTSRWPITVDGVRLDTLAYNISTRQGRDAAAEILGANVATEMRHGELWTAHKKYGPGRMYLNMWVSGCDVDGIVPVDEYSEYRDNLDMLRRLFGVRHRLLDVRQTVSETGPVIRQAMCEAMAIIDPTMRVAYPYTSEFTVELRIPDAFWFDLAETTFDTGIGYVSNTTEDLSAEFGVSTAPITNLYLVVDGPAVNPQVFDNISGHWIQLNQTVPNGQQWVVNTRTWSSKVGAAIEFTDTGLDVYESTTFAGSHSPRMFGIAPEHTGPEVRMTGTGFGANTRLRIRAKNAYL